MRLGGALLGILAAGLRLTQRFQLALDLGCPAFGGLAARLGLAQRALLAFLLLFEAPSGGLMGLRLRLGVALLSLVAVGRRPVGRLFRLGGAPRQNVLDPGLRLALFFFFATGGLFALLGRLPENVEFALRLGGLAGRSFVACLRLAPGL